jgi:lipopolysaccharide export system protein LptA
LNVWTPRRVLLLILGMVLFGSAFGVYARFLGWIDGLPELPEPLLSRRVETDPIVEPPFSPVEVKLQQAFGPNCVEISYLYKIEMRTKGMVLAANYCVIDPEGRVKLWPFSLATFKERAGQEPEINTVYSDLCYLQFDRPVKSLAEIGERRIVGCQLETDPHALSADPRRGRVLLVNNRGTVTPDDDLVLETPGPVYYREAAQPNLPLDKARPQIETNAAVQMVDRRHQPDSTTITAQGMQVFLASETPVPSGPVHKQKPHGSAVTGVRRVILPSAVNMSLWSDSQEGFLSNGAKPPPTPPGAQPVDRNHVLITTPGQFTYDVLPDGDRAKFERLPPAATPLPNCVSVVRPLARGPNVHLNDQLECDTLEIQFAAKPPPEQHKPGAPPPPKTAPAKDDDRQSINWAHAWGQFIVLTSDAEKLEAHGNDLVYEARTKGSTLKGLPEMVALKDGHEIHAPELTMFGADGKVGRRAEAHGAGYFRLLDKTGTKRTMEARWRDFMTYQQNEGGDLLTLNGDAAFEDRENNQLLRSDSLKLWVAPDPKPAGTPPIQSDSKPKATDDDDTPKFHPQRLEATGHVFLRTPDLVDHDTDQLVLLFKDGPPLPKAQQPPAAASPWATPLTPGSATTSPQGQPGAAGPPAPPPAKKPIDLSARSVQANVIRRGDVNELDTVHCEDDVRVHQDPVPPQDKPTDMRGRALQLRHRPTGNILTVTGTVTNGIVSVPGEVHLPDLSLIGPFIVIDQVENTAEVQGMGSMRMISTTDFEGKKLAKPTPLTITWKQGMRFTGKQAVFRGSVQADQESTTLLCQTMQVDLNRPVSLSQQPNEARGGKDPAKVDKVVCDAGAENPQGVIITDTLRDNGRLVSSRRITADEVAIHNEEGWMDAANNGTGRGMVRIVQFGPKDDPGGQPKGPKRPPTAAQPAEQVWMMTLIRYNGTMKVNNQSRTAQFFNDVEMLRLQADSAEQQISFDSTVNKLPAGALYLRSNQMTVLSTKTPNGPARQEMVATGRANVTWGEEFFGTGDVIKYDESKQQLTLEGLNGGVATARRLYPGGADRGKIIARKIIYNRQQDTISVEDGYSGSSGH